jgi:pimeloyl-ACP methyl ester carboxylesterase
MRGYGESDKPKNVDDYRAEMIVDDLQQLIEKLGK